MRVFLLTRAGLNPPQRRERWRHQAPGKPPSPSQNHPQVGAPRTHAGWCRPTGTRLCSRAGTLAALPPLAPHTPQPTSVRRVPQTDGAQSPPRGAGAKRCDGEGLPPAQRPLTHPTSWHTPCLEPQMWTTAAKQGGSLKRGRNRRGQTRTRRLPRRRAQQHGSAAAPAVAAGHGPGEGCQEHPGCGAARQEGAVPHPVLNQGGCPGAGLRHLQTQHLSSAGSGVFTAVRDVPRQSSAIEMLNAISARSQDSFHAG